MLLLFIIFDGSQPKHAASALDIASVRCSCLSDWLLLQLYALPLSETQAVRNLDDMETMSIPQKYRQIMTFYKYYSGEKVAPIPTIFSK